jgi:hypothetical protein
MIFPRLCFLVVALTLAVGPLWAQSTLEALLAEIPSLDTGTPNKYCITDVQYAMDADLSWNPLLKRAVLKEDKSGVSITLIVGSKFGRVGGKLVEWPEEPALHDGQIYVSEGVLALVFQTYPDFRLPSQQTADPTPTPTVGPVGDVAPPEEPPSVPGAAQNLKIKSVGVLFLPVHGEVPAASPAVGNATERLLMEVNASLTQAGISVHPARWNPRDQRLVENQPSDALVAFQVEFASPTAATCFFTFDAASLPDAGRTTGLYEWGKVDPEQQRASREVATALSQGYSELVGEDRAIGIRSGPHALLRGRQKPAVLVCLGVDTKRPVEDMRTAASSLAAGLSRMLNE